MKKIVILNAENKETEVNVVRYFKYENDYFLIFTYDEIDEKGKQKLYFVQILDELGEKVARNITDMDEWNSIQKMIKEAIKQIKKGNDNSVEMLNVYELNNIKIDNPREFKVDPKLVKLLNMDIIDDVSDDDFDLMNMLEVPNEQMEEDKNLNNDGETKMQAEESVGINNNNDNDNNGEKNIDYKQMYYALKEDNEATELLLNDLMEKLLLYKEKYGELSQVQD